ncbi:MULTISPECIES: GNAT family N-acetyltransferase [Psychrilyobacter]|uniref:GNAT family N-acetyltransferase n=1 Tax=Psychrilyobacter piezotolerans TaxID=2293438 RepID=A0ABX9KDQ1_9FUSO|nr:MULTISPECIES: GNAT family N-acetyltransferase [Psychrilyobacter]MCS5422046.1 GNAT family N-acetyltransferase [Psychrilyobacter sp. S5]NDI79005.1 GNAT family N-acetyltransferase [Psychrilyobacter piezotolerans]RDE59136.1 N-acetyltransferase [Psychrilyobacter sp. S5]REI39703.1 GNAT family N-acetyltransferase [Psychrilyobacter piezotolerans]
MEIKKPFKSHLPQLEEFFKTVISDTAAKEEIKIPDFVDEEVKEKMKYCEDYFKKGSNISILIALDGEKIIGTISSSYCDSDIKSVIKDLKKDSMKIGTVYIHPSYQRKGLAKILLNEMYKILRSKNVEKFYLDSGYKSAQRYWTKNLGEPFFTAKDYWGPKMDNLIWKVKL